VGFISLWLVSLKWRGKFIMVISVLCAFLPVKHQQQHQLLSVFSVILS